MSSTSGVSGDMLLLADAVIQAAEDAATAVSPASAPQQVATRELLYKVWGLDTRLITFFAKYSKTQQFVEAIKQLLVHWEGVSLGLHGHCLQLFGFLVSHVKSVNFSPVFDAGVVALLWHYRYVYIYLLYIFAAAYL